MFHFQFCHYRFFYFQLDVASFDAYHHALVVNKSKDNSVLVANFDANETVVTELCCSLSTTVNPISPQFRYIKMLTAKLNAVK